MGLLLDKIKENFGTENSFSAWDLHLITKINFKVIQMCLKKMHSKEVLYQNQKYGIYQLKTDDEIVKDKIKVNELIDKYNLANKKYIL
jgi:hypothetical protein